MNGRTSRRGLPGLLARQAATGLGTTVTVAVIVFAIALLAAGAPRAIATLFTDSLQSAIAATPPADRDLTASTRGGPLPGAGAQDELPEPLGNVWGRHEAALASVRADMPAALRHATGPARYAVVFDPAPAKPVGPAEGAPHTQLSLAFDPHLAERVTITHGSAPVRVTEALPSEAPIDVMLSNASATRMQLAVGDRRALSLPDGSRQMVRLSGIFEANDPHAEDWELVPSSLRPTVLSGGMEPIVFGLAYVDPGSWPKAQPLAQYARTVAWYPVLPERLTSAGADRFATGLRSFTRIPHAVGPATAGVAGSFPPVSALTFGSSLGRVVQEVGVRTAATSAVLAMTAAGPIGVALGALLLGARLIVDRRTPALRLAAARGASARQLRTVLAVEGAVIGLPAAAAGALVAALLVPGRPTVAGMLLPALVGLVPVALLAAALPYEGRRRRSDLQRTRHRLAVEVLVVGLAVVSVVLLSQRGLTTATASLGVDPLLAAAPLLLSLAACVLVLRLYPVPLQLLASRLKAGRGLVGFLGSVRAVRDPLAGFAPVLAMVVGVSVAVFSAGVLGTVTAGIDAAARAATGADVSVSASYLSAEQMTDIGALSGVETVASVDESGVIVTIDGDRQPAGVLSVPVSDLRAVQQGVPGAIDLPRRLGQATDDHVPVVLSADLGAALRPGAHLELAGVTLDVVAIAPSVSPLTERRDWVLVDRANAELLTGSAPAPTRALVDVAADADVRSVASGIRRLLGPDAAIDTPADGAAAAEADPAVRGLQAALLLAVLVAWLLTAITVVLTLVLGTPARARLLALLGALGMRRRAPSGLVAWEIAPVAVTALVAGSVLGCVLPLVVLAGVDLRPFTHGQVQPAFQLDPGLLAAVLGGFALVVVAASAIALGLAARADQAEELRSSEEG